MLIHERRQHIRIEDNIYFSYHILEPGESYSERMVADKILSNHEKRYFDASHYFKELDYKMNELIQAISLKDTTLASVLNLLNAKIDYLSRQILLTNTTELQKVDLSLGGIAFHAYDLIKEKTPLILMIYTKPKMIPIIVEGIVVYSKYQSEHNYRTAVTFNKLNQEQVELLSQHILLAQVKTRSD